MVCALADKWHTAVGIHSPTLGAYQDSPPPLNASSHQLRDRLSSKTILLVKD